MDPSVTGGFAMITHQTWFLIGLLVLGVQVAERATTATDDGGLRQFGCFMRPAGTRGAKGVRSGAPPDDPRAARGPDHDRPAGQVRTSQNLLPGPPNVWLQTGVKFVFDPKAPPFVVPFRWCVSDRCLADAELTDAQVTRLRAQGANPGKVEFKEASQRDVSIPVSFKGFALALDAIRNQ